MYSYEIDALIKQYNYNIPSKIYSQISNPKINPQISKVHYNAFQNNYTIETYDNYSWTFSVYYQA